MINLRKILWLEYVADKREMRNAYIILVGDAKRKMSLEET
jgi:hypothetical protein